MASVKRIAVIAAVVLLLSMAVVGAGAADGETTYTVTITTTENTGISGSHGVSYMYSTDGGTTYVAYNTPFDVTADTVVTIKAICSNSIIRPQDWNISNNVSFSSIIRENYNLTFTMPASAVTITVEEGKILPYEYVEVDYIQSGSLQWINTGIKSTITTGYKIYFEIDTMTSNPMIIGTQSVGGGGGSNYGIIVGTSSEGNRLAYGDGGWRFTSTVAHEDEYNFWYYNYRQNDVVTDGKNVNASLSSNRGVPSGLDIYMFCMNANGSKPAGTYVAAKLFGCKITVGANLVRDYVPCIYHYGQMDAVAGLYDTINDVFYRSENSIDFIAGSIARVSVQYIGNDETSGNAPVDAGNPYSIGTSVTVLGNTGDLKKTGYTFAGWNTNADGSGITYLKTETFTIMNNTTLYAKWDYTVTYNENGGYGAVPAQQTSCYGQSVQVATQGNLTKTGSVFTGWNTKANGTGTQYQPGDTYPGDTVTLYAQWTSPSFTFTIPASVPLSQDTTQKVTGDSCVVTIGSNKAVAGKVLRVNVSSDATVDDGKKILFSLSGTGGNATYRVGKWNNGSAGAYIEGNDPSAAYGNEVVKLDISTGSNLSASQQLFFETKSYDGAGSYSGVLNFAFEVTTKVTGISISGPTTVDPGSSIALTANVLPTDAIDNTVTWTSSDTSIATVDTNGIVTGVANGTVTITATANDGSGVSGTYGVKVGILPFGYTEVEYIESTGTQYIDTGYYATTNTKFEISFKTPSSVKTNKVLFGGCNGGSYSAGEISIWWNGGSFEAVRPSSNTGSNVISPCHSCTSDTMYSIVYDKDSLVINGDIQSSGFADNYTCSRSVYIFNCHRSGYIGNAWMGTYALYSFKIWESGTLKRDLVPCIRNSDGAVGLYDAVEGKFYGNANTSSDDFKAGPVVYQGTTSVTGIVLDKSSASVKAGETVTLTATVSPTDATYKFVNWSSSDQSVAYVRNGVVTGVKAGVVTITASTVDGGYTETCEVTVTTS